MSVDLIRLFSLFLVIALGIITLVSDIKHGKVKNKVLVIFAILGMVNDFMNYYYLRAILIKYMYIILILIVGFILWRINVFSAGDVKLFVVFNILIPPIENLTLLFLVNSLIFVFLFVLVLSLYRFGSLTLENNQRIRIGIKKFSPFQQTKNFLYYLLVLFGLSWLTKLIMEQFNITQMSQYMLRLALISAVVILFDKYSIKLKLHNPKKVFTFIYGLVALLHIYVDFSTISTAAYWKDFLLISIGFYLFRTVFTRNRSLFTKKVKINDLKKGMVLHYAITDKFEKYDRGSKPSNVSFFYSPSEKLSDEQIASLKDKESQGKLSYSHVRVQENIPFAPFISAAALFTFITKTTIFLYLMR